MLESGKEKFRKDRTEDKDEERWNNVDNLWDFTRLDKSYTVKLNEKVKAKDDNTPAKKYFEFRMKTLELRRHPKILLS